MAPMDVNMELPFGLEPHQPDAFARGASVLLDDPRRKSARLLEPFVEGLLVVVRKRVLKSNTSEWMKRNCSHASAEAQASQTLMNRASAAIV